jgi:hypothetical protein
MRNASSCGDGRSNLSSSSIVLSGIFRESGTTHFDGDLVISPVGTELMDLARCKRCPIFFGNAGMCPAQRCRRDRGCG